jgi:hypothetical protein
MSDAMPRALKRSGWLLMAAGIIALAYHVGNRTAPSIPYEPPSYDATDLAAPTPIADDAPGTEVQSLPAGEMANARRSAPRARIISLTAVGGNNQRQKTVLAPPAIVHGHDQQQKSAGIQIVDVKALPTRESLHRAVVPVKHEQSFPRNSSLPAPPVNSLKFLPRVSPDVQPSVRGQSPPPILRTSAVLPQGNTNLVSNPECSKAVPVTPSAGESIGVVFLESRQGAAASAPRELPASVTDSAPLLATQKLISRSLGNPTGVAARLANSQANPADSRKGRVVLASAEPEADLPRPLIDDAAPKAYTTTGVVSLRATKEEIAAQAHLDYVSSGLVILPPSEEPTIRPPSSVQEFLVKNAIRRVCGDEIKDLQVKLESNRCLRIRLNVPSSSDQEQLSRTILTLPELAHYQINLSVEAHQ